MEDANEKQLIKALRDDMEKRFDGVFDVIGS